MTKKKSSESAETSGLHPAVPDRYPAFYMVVINSSRVKARLPE